MATQDAMARMDETARRRITAATSTLADRFGLDVAPPTFERDPKMAMIRQLESHADVLDALVAASESKKAARDAEKSAAKLPADVSAEVTKDGTPVVVTEAPPKASTKGKDK